MRRPFLLVLPVVLLAAGCSGGDAPAPRLADVGRSDVREVVDAPGTVTAKAVSTLTAPADATVAAVLVKDGDTVRPGQVLVRLSSPSAQDRLRQAEAAAAGASTRVRLPRADLGPLQDQLDAAAAAAHEAGRAAAGQVPDEALRAQALAAVDAADDRYRAAAAAARAAVEQANAGVAGLEQALSAVGSSQRAQAQVLVAAARATVDALVVTAPLGGVATLGGTPPAAGGPAGGLTSLLGQLPPEVQGPAGTALGAGGGAAAPTTSGDLAVGRQVASGTALVTVTDVSGLGVTAEVDETDVLLVRPGVQADLDLDAVPGQAYTALVTAVDVSPTTSAAGGVTYRVRLSLTEPPAGRPRPLPGMSAVVGLRVREALAAVSVPSSAVVRDGAADVVFVLDGDTYRRRAVQVGASGEDRVEVVSGVAVGERVVVTDADGLRDGQRRG